MNCCQCQGIEDLFNEKSVAKELDQYRKKGPNATTRMMTDALKARGVQGMTLLDIGGGVGAVQHDLFQAGLQAATDIDASLSYIKAAREEARRRGLADRIRFQHGNFVELASQIAPADVVTLDRVICCYPDMEQLVELSVARARRLYGVVYPRDTWWARIGIKILNGIFRLQKSSFRTFVHPSAVVEALVRRHGFERKFTRETAIWQVIVYERLGIPETS